MSDYPRPPQPPLPPRFLPDRIVGGAGFLYIAGSSAWSLIRMLQGNGTTVLVREYGGFLATVLVFTLLLMWLFVLVAKGRRGGFMALTMLISLLLIAAFFTGRSVWMVHYFIVWVYCVARLFRLLGPRLTGAR